MSGRQQMQSTRRGGLRAEAAKDKKKNKRKRDDKRTTQPRDIGVEGGRDIRNSAFKLYLVDKQERIDITPLVESIEWSESSENDNINSWPSLSGSITVRQQNPRGYEFPPLEPNRIIDCYCFDEKIWRMRVVKPGFSAADGTVSIELQDEMRQLSLPRGRFRYTANKSHKNGWAPDEIAKDICRKYKIPYKQFLVMKVNGTGARIRLAKVDRKSDSPLGVIRYAYEEARKRSAHRYLLRWNYEDNKLEAVPMRESDKMYEFYSSQITEATVEIENRPDFATALRVYWYKPKPRKAKKNWKPKKEQLKFTVNGKKTAVLTPEDKTVIQRYGYIERRIEFAAGSEKEARDKAINSLAKRIRPKKSLSFTVAGEPNIRRGDFIRVNLPAQGFDRQQMWVQSVTHSVAERYTMQVTARFDNPFSPSLLRKEKAAAARYKKRAERKEKSAAGRGSRGSGQNLAAGQRPKKGVVYTIGASSYGFTAGDDNGKDVKGLSLFSGNPAVAELGQGGVGGAMGLKVAGGGPDYGMQCRITYQGRSTIAYFRDVGSGGGPVKGRPRVIDLHARVAREIGFPNGLDLVQFERLS